MPGSTNEHLTDVGNARRFLRQWGEDLLYVVEWGKWARWNGVHWERDERDAVAELASRLPDLLLAEAAMEPSKNLKLLLVRHALASQASGRITALLTLARSMRATSLAQFDTNQHLLVCPNGTVNLRDGSLRPNDRADLVTRCSPVDYDPTARCPQFLAFLDEIMSGNAALVDWLQKALGYAMTGSTGEQCFFVFYGVGANGKSTLLEIVKHLAGGYARTSNFATFADRQNYNGPSEDVARLAGARLVTAVESDQGVSFKESLLKQMTGGELVAARYLYQSTFEFRPSFKIFFSTNYKPSIKGSDEGIWRRIRLVPFRVVIPEARREKDLSDRLIAEEGQGILAWLIEGAIRWHREGLGMPQEVREATAEYKSEMDTLQEFLDGCCEADEAAEIKFTELYDAYGAWCEANGERPLSGRWFGMRLGEKGYVGAKRNSVVVRRGLRLGPGAPRREDKRADFGAQTGFDNMLS